MKSPFVIATVVIILIGFCSPVSAQLDLFWNGGNTASSPAAGGTGIWSGNAAWRSITSSGSQATWSAGNTTNNGFLEGVGGIITLGTSGTADFSGTNLTVNTSGYTIATSSASRNLAFSGTLSIANNVGLTLSSSGGSAHSFGAISFGTGSSLLIQGGASSSTTNRITLTSATTINGGSITLSGTGDGATGFVSARSIATGGVTLNTYITNNSNTSASMLGATNGDMLTYGGVLSGTANLQISAATNGSGGAGITVLANNSTYSGDTFLNSNTNGVLRIGVNDALPTGTTIFFGRSASGVNNDFGGSIDLNGRGLSIGGLEGGSNTRGVANNTSTLSTITIGKTVGSNTFAGTIGTVLNSNLTTQSSNIALVKNGNSTQVLSSSNNYSGSTTINGGTLSIASTGSIAGSGVTVASGGKLNVYGLVNTSVNIAVGGMLTGSGSLGTTTINGVHSPGNSPGLQTFGSGLSYNAGSSLSWEIISDALGVRGLNFDAIDVTGGTLTINAGATANLIFNGNGSTVLWSNSFWDVDQQWLVYDNANAPTLASSSIFASINASADSGNNLLTSIRSGASFSWSQSGNDIFLNYHSITAVPEPSSLALIGVVFAGVAFVRRRKFSV